MFSLRSTLCLGFAVVVVGCSGSLGDGAEAETPDDDASADVSVDDAALDPEGGGADAPPDTVTTDAYVTAPPKCGVVACDENKTHYPKIQAAYERHGGATQLGTPKDNGGTQFVHAWGAGRVQDFDGGALGPAVLSEADSAEAWAKDAHLVRGKIRETWLALGGADGFGHPKEDERAGPGGQVQLFEKGCIGPDGRGGFDGYDACEAPPDLVPVLETIGTTAATSSPGTDLGIAVSWLPTGKRWSRRGDVVRTSASSAKWFWAMAALAKNSVATVQPKAIPTFEQSDNYTAGDLIDLAGGPNAVNDFTTQTLGIPITQLSLCGWSFGKTRRATNCSDLAGGDNFFTPNGALTFLEHSWKRTSIGVEKGDALLGWAKRSPRTGYGAWGSTQLPAATRALVHHKAGWLPTGCCSAGYPAHYNDIGLVPTARGAYAVVLSMKGGTDAKMTKTMEWSACMIFHALVRDVADPKTACTSP